jgi:hypothetical protein
LLIKFRVFRIHYNSSSSFAPAKLDNLSQTAHFTLLKNYQTPPSFDGKTVKFSERMADTATINSLRQTNHRLSLSDIEPSSNIDLIELLFFP